MAKKISKGSVDRSKQQPTTGNGRTGGQKPNLADTNLPKPGFIAGLFTRRSQPGKHSR